MSEKNDTSTNERDIEGLLGHLVDGQQEEYALLTSKSAHAYHAALIALLAERNALQAKVTEHAEDRRKYIDAWADWIEANAGLEIDQWLRVYADAVPIPSPDGDEAKQRIFKHLDQRMRDASDAIDALRKLVEYMKELNTAAASIICERDALKQRAAELESQPPASDLRERLVCAALTGVMAHPSTVGNPKYLAEIAVAHADAAIAAMRKGEGDAK